MKKVAYKLEELCDIKSGKRLPVNCDFSPVVTDFPYIRARDIKGGKISVDDLVYIEQDVQAKISKYIIETGDIAITIVGASVGDIGFADEVVHGYNLTENAVRLTQFNDKVYNKYLFYTLFQRQYRAYMQLIAGAAAQPKLGIYKIRNIRVELPDRDIQVKISSILSAYDDLIENNNRRIKILEQMAENLYKEWFSYKNIKKSAEYTRLSDILQIVRGISYSSDEINVEEGLNLINLKNIESYGGFRQDGTKKYDGKYKQQQVVCCGDLVMGVTDMTQDRRTVGSVAIVPKLEGTSVISADLIKISSSIDNLFLYAMFKYGKVSRHIAQFANGANVLHLKPQDILKIKVLLPKDNLISKYVSSVAPMFHEMEKLNLMNTNLIKQRDLLLPRLMSGKLEV